jgi:two-component system OmpR family response regulator
MTPIRSETRPMLCFAGWRLDVARLELRSASDTLVLSVGEFDLLLALAPVARRRIGANLLRPQSI